MKRWNTGRFIIRDDMYCPRCGQYTRIEHYDKYQHSLTANCSTCNEFWLWDYRTMSWKEKPENSCLYCGGRGYDTQTNEDCRECSGTGIMTELEHITFIEDDLPF